MYTHLHTYKNTSNATHNTQNTEYHCKRKKNKQFIFIECISNFLTITLRNQINANKTSDNKLSICNKTKIKKKND